MSKKIKIRGTKSNFFVLLFILFCSSHSFSQNLFYQGIFYGGVTSGGFSTGQGSGSGSFSLYIESGSTIKKAYLFTYRIGYPPNVPITINGSPYLFDTTNIVMQVNHKSTFASPVHLYYYDFTDSLNANITSTFNVTIPSQISLPVNWGYWTIFIYIAYENPALSSVATSVWINDEDFLGNQFYNYQNLTPIDNSNPVALSLYSDRTSDTIFSDGYNAYVNSNFIGTIGGFDNASNGGVKGHFYYQNATLFGLDDDTPDSLMGGSDGLADIKTYINNNDTAFDFRLTHQKYPNNLATRTNINLAEILTYTTPCDTFTTTITPNDTICLGDSIQLQATGGVQYAWFGAFGGLSDTSIANPMASPPQTTTYIVTITNDSGCVKTEQVKIWVMPPAVIDSISTAATICGSSTGSITTYFNGNFNFTLLDSNLTVVSNNTTGVFTQLPQGNYILQSTTSVYGCTYNYYDTLNINYVNLTHAAFIRNPWQGKAPLTVNFTNISSNANQYVWLFPADTFYTQNLTYTFDSGGVYPVCLIAQNNYAYCTDTACYTFIVEGNTSVLIPNVFTPNSDGSNDVFTLQITDADLITNLEVAIYNRWGEKLYRYQNNQATTTVSLWNGTTPKGKPAPEGTYFYVLTYTTIKGEVKSEKGTVTLLR